MIFKVSQFTMTQKARKINQMLGPDSSDVINAHDFLLMESSSVCCLTDTTVA